MFIAKSLRPWVLFAAFICLSAQQLWSSLVPRIETRSLTFYAAPLVCNAAPQIGCGSRAKPILLDLMQNSRIAEAWLNRSGTTIAIVWTEAVKDSLQAAITLDVFGRHDFEASLLQSADAEAALFDFSNSGQWYRGRDVDRLSIEEAALTTEVILNKLAEFQDLSREIRYPMSEEIRQVLIRWFTDDRLAARMHSDEAAAARQQISEEIIAIGRKYIGDEVMQKILDSL